MSKPFADIDAIRATAEAVAREPALDRVTFNLQGNATGGLAFCGAIGPCQLSCRDLAVRASCRRTSSH